MNAQKIKEELCKVIIEIQSISGLDCPTLDGTTTPANDVKEFTSIVWPIAISMLEEKIEIEIPDDENLFYDDDSKRALTIDQCVEKVFSIIKKTNPISDDEMKPNE